MKWWMVTLASLVGVVLNVNRVRLGFAVWMITNLLWMVRTFRLKAYEQTALYGVYWLLAVWGWFAWGAA